MIQAASLIAAVSGFVHMQLRRKLRVIHGSVMAAAIGEGSGNADGTEGIQSVGILKHLAFQSGRGLGIRSLKGYGGNGGNDLLGGSFIHMGPGHDVPGILIILSGKEFRVIGVVEQSTEAHNEDVAAFCLTNDSGGVLHTDGVPRIMTGIIICEETADFVSHIIEDSFLLLHAHAPFGRITVFIIKVGRRKNKGKDNKKTMDGNEKKVHAVLLFGRN